MRFFITERGDLSHQLDKAKQFLQLNFQSGDALLAISKNVDDQRLRHFLITRRDHTIFHATITGYGSTMLEPGVADSEGALEGLKALIDDGFPANQIVLRVDPIIPTEKGLSVAQQVIQKADRRVRRIRFSFIDGYKNIKSILPWSSFHAPDRLQKAAMEMLIANADGRSIEACGEPQLSENSGCISSRDYQILGLPLPAKSYKGQRTGCQCLGTKVEMLEKPDRCPNQCRYCYYGLGERIED